MVGIRLLLALAAFGAAGAASAADQADAGRELECLATAIAYEAGREPADGQAAVAQVVLNRVAHPAYPKTVCGVVYQGSQRRTGCQFTFTCDGSLGRRLPDALLAKARMVAEQALAGAGSEIVGVGAGGATHYHATYVRPYWAASLAEVATIGLHRFYRAMRGALPSAAASAQAPAQPGTFTVWGLTAGIVLPAR